MKNKKIIIAGGTGFIGQEMIKYFGKENSIVVLTRNISGAFNNRNHYSSLQKNDIINTRFVKWDGITEGDWMNELEGADILINLAGQSVNCRYNEKNKQKIFDSRTYSTKILGTAIQKCNIAPQLWINASSATIYPDSRDHPNDEYCNKFDTDFSVRVCQLWEKTFYEQATPFTRKVALRMAITLGPGGILIPYFNLLKFGLGGKQGNGKQMYSWVHIEDTCRMIEWIFDHKEIKGTYNCSSPHPVNNKTFMKRLRSCTHHKFGLPAYEWMLKLGAIFLGTETELILKSRWVLPTKMLESGFEFKLSKLEDAFKDIVKQVPRKQYHLF